MTKNEFAKEIIITAERGSYLKIANLENSEEIIGKPERIIFSKDGIIPEVEEINL